MSRLFESLGDNADEAGVSDGAEVEGDEAFAGAILEDAPIEPLSAAILDAPLPAAPTAPARSESHTTSALRTDDPGPLDRRSPIAAAMAYDIPDFEKDDRDLSAYEDAKRRHIRQQTSSGETAIQASFAQKRNQLQIEVKNAKSFEDERHAAAVHTTRLYANRYPHHVDKKGITAPSFWENLFSFGSAGRMFREAYIAGEALEALRVAMRKREEALAALDGQLQRALYLKEESVKKSMETQAGIDEFHARPEIKSLFKRVEAIRKERETFEKRVDRGDVSDEELRDRGVAEHKLTYAELPLMGVIIAKVARYGRLAYFQLRDLDNKESLLSYDSRLDPLRNSVFDVYPIAGAVAAKLRRNDNGTAFRVADHFKAVWRNQEKAEELYSQHRSALRDDRGLPTMTPRNEAEAEIIERLANLATLVDGGQTREPVQTPIPNAPTVKP